MSFRQIEEHLEKITGISVSDIRNMTITEFRKVIEVKNKTKTSFTSASPTIGRGSVLRDCLINSDELNKEVDAILRGGV